MEEIVARLGKNLAELRQNFRSGRTRGLVWRKTQLRAILKLVAENEDEIFEALNRDLGKHPAEAYRDEVSTHFSFFFQVELCEHEENPGISVAVELDFLGISQV